MANIDVELGNVAAGAVPDDFRIDRRLAESWDGLEGSGEGGMEAYKLLGRMEKVRWQPPILSFVIERHGGITNGSTRAELQHWEVDLDARTARIVKSGHRQLKRMSARLSIKEMADEIARKILNGENDERFRRSDDGSVAICLSSIFPTGSGFKRTVEGRRNRLADYIAEKLNGAGWNRMQRDTFRLSETASAVT